jgi:two-component system LytT family sensor kinase
MNFIKNIDLKRILSHSLFWFSFLIIHFVTKSFDYKKYDDLIYIFLSETIIQAIGAYVLIYVLIPNLLIQKKYFVFIVLFAIWLYLVFTMLITLKYFYLEPKFPQYFLEWDKCPDTLIQRLTSFRLFFAKTIWLFFPASVMGLIRFYKNQQHLSKIEEEKKSMELKALKNQLNPHFLFNTLNNLYALTLKKDDKAPEIIAKLSEILDFVLYRCNEDFVSIEKEITLIENYIALEKLRYNENRLNISFTKDIQENSKISPLIILTFIENSFKHGVINETEKAVIRMNLETKKQQIIFSIENTKPQNETARRSDKSQIGLENVRKQLDLLYPKKHQLEIVENQKKFLVKLTLTV